MIFEIPMLLMKFRDINVMLYSLEVGWLMVDPMRQVSLECDINIAVN